MVKFRGFIAADINATTKIINFENEIEQMSILYITILFQKHMRLVAILYSAFHSEFGIESKGPIVSHST